MFREPDEEWLRFIRERADRYRELRMPLAAERCDEEAAILEARLRPQPKVDLDGAA